MKGGISGGGKEGRDCVGRVISHKFCLILIL